MCLEPISIKDRTIILMNDVTGDNIKPIIEKIEEINNADDEWFNEFKNLSPSLKDLHRDFVIPKIKLILGTYGGSVYDGLGLYDTIKKSKTPIEIICTGKIMSMGVIIALASKLRSSYEHTTFMIHSISSISYGQVQGLEDDVEETKRLNDIIFNIISDNTSISLEKLKDIKEHKKDWYMSAKEAASYGIVTNIIN